MNIPQRSTRRHGRRHIFKIILFLFFIFTVAPSSSLGRRTGFSGGRFPGSFSNCHNFVISQRNQVIQKRELYPLKRQREWYLAQHLVRRGLAGNCLESLGGRRKLGIFQMSITSSILNEIE